ncbi:MAG: hypothetical protein ACSHXI_16460 [Hoeflea sp.]|uniref:hypothetical protein n=1 Tax=Hoeflea sp. TaxID=1940281 RepID=UPI003EF9E855
MTHYQSSLGTIIGINARLLYAALMSAVAWYIWPESMRGYGWGFISICLWGSSIALFIEACKSAVKLFARDRAVSKYLAQGNKPKTAEMASSQALKNAGMTDE